MPAGRVLFSHARSSRSWRRASAATSRGSSARFCTSASVCSTESCRCAATSARSCERIRAARSAVSPRTSRSHHGARMIVDRDQHDRDRQDDVARGRERVVERQEQQRAADDQRGADARPVDRLARQLIAQRAGFRVGGLGLAPDQRAARRRDHRRPDDLVAEPQPPLAQQQDRRERQAGHPGGDKPGVAAVEQARDHGPLRTLGRDQRPSDDVERDARPARGEREHEPDPDQERIDPEAGGEAGADAADVAIRGVAPHGLVTPRRGRRRRLGDRRAELFVGHSLSPATSRTAPNAASTAGSM